jgi:hypothetical protein
MSRMCNVDKTEEVWPFAKKCWRSAVCQQQFGIGAGSPPATPLRTSWIELQSCAVCMLEACCGVRIVAVNYWMR